MLTLSSRRILHRTLVHIAMEWLTHLWKKTATKLGSASRNGQLLSLELNALMVMTSPIAVMLSDGFRSYRRLSHLHQI